MRAACVLSVLAVSSVGPLPLTRAFGDGAAVGQSIGMLRIQAEGFVKFGEGFIKTAA